MAHASTCTIGTGTRLSSVPTLRVLEHDANANPLVLQAGMAERLHRIDAAVKTEMVRDIARVKRRRCHSVCCDASHCLARWCSLGIPLAPGFDQPAAGEGRPASEAENGPAGSAAYEAIDSAYNGAGVGGNNTTLHTVVVQGAVCSGRSVPRVSPDNSTVIRAGRGGAATTPRCGAGGTLPRLAVAGWAVWAEDPQQACPCARLHEIQQLAGARPRGSSSQLESRVGECRTKRCICGVDWAVARRTSRGDYMSVYVL